MEIYLVIYFVLCAFTILDIYYILPDRIIHLFYFITYLMIIILVGLRWETGTDWMAYVEHFEGISDFASTSPLLTQMEYGYSILCYLVKIFSSNYTTLLIIHSIIYYFFIFKGIKRLSPYFFLSVLLFCAFTMGVLGSHRQLLAVALIFYGTKFIFSRNFILYLFIVLIASIFHTTALLCIILYFLNRDFSTIALISIICIAFVLGKTNIPAKAFGLIGALDGIGDKLMFYLEGGKDTAKEYGVSIIGLIKRLLFVGVFIYGKDSLSKKIPYYAAILNFYIVGIVVYFLFSSSLTVLVSRGGLYFNVFEPVLISCQLLLFTSAKDRVILASGLFIFTIFYFTQSIAEYPDLFLPYKGLFINTDYVRELR